MANPLAVNRTVQYFKWDGTVHWRHNVVYLGEDEHGTWVGAKKGSTHQKGEQPPIVVPADFVQLIPVDKMWSAIFDAPGGNYEIYIDLTTPAKWTTATRVEMIDMDLDVVRNLDGSTELLDEDEFEEHSALYGYPVGVITETRQTAQELMTRVAEHREPFGNASARWLAAIGSEA